MRTLVKPDLGVKRVCPSCGARFYDLQKRPIECPKCAFTFEPEALLKQRRPRPVDTPVAQPVVAEAEPEEAEEVEEAETEPVVEAEEAEVAVEAEEETVEAEVETPEPTPAPAETTAEPVEEFEEEAEEEEAQDDNLLEEVEEEEDDVSGIIDADIEKEEP